MATEEEKELYTKEAKSFANSLVTNLGDVTGDDIIYYNIYIHRFGKCFEC